MFKSILFLSLLVCVALSVDNTFHVNGVVHTCPAHYHLCGLVSDEVRATFRHSKRDGSGILAPSVSHVGPGVSFARASVSLQGRTAVGPSVVQPAVLTISGIPAGSTLVRAYLWAGAASNVQADQVNVALVNPDAGASSFTLTSIGFTTSTNWGYGNSESFRADVTSSIGATLNGDYILSGVEVNVGGGVFALRDTNGVSLVIVYQEPSPTFIGHFLVDDGAVVIGTADGSGASFSHQMNFSPIATQPTLVEAFLMAADFQSTTNSAVEPLTLNGFNVLNYLPPFMWNFFSTLSSPLAVGQSASLFAKVLAADAQHYVAAGLYFRQPLIVNTE